jgi:hypothetical protein
LQYPFEFNVNRELKKESFGCESGKIIEDKK